MVKTLDVDGDFYTQSIVNRKTSKKRIVEPLIESTNKVDIDLSLPPKFKEFLRPHRYKVAYGGRCGYKSHSIAKILLLLATQQPLRVLCCREFMSSINDSIHQLLVDKITELHLESHFEVEKMEIKGKNGSTFRFQGLRNNISQVQSYEGIDICFCEEAANISEYSWTKLIPTVRNGKTLKGKAEIWIAFNPEWEQDATFSRFVLNPPTDSVVIKTNAEDHPEWIPLSIKNEIEEMKERNPEMYRHVYLGECRKYLDGSVFKDQILRAEQEERFTSVPYNPRLGVHAFWDLGYSDSCAIWFAQIFGSEIHLINYIENSQRPYGYYLKEISELDFPIECHWLPHDAVGEGKFSTGMSIEELIRNKGNKVKIVPNIGVENGLNAVREIFHTCWFDVKKCDVGIRALRTYQYETVRKKGNENTGFKNAPVHNWSSHGSDSFRYLAVSLRPAKNEKKLSLTPHRNPNATQTSWMVM